MSILLAAGCGVIVAGMAAHALVDACFAATQHWVSSSHCAPDSFVRGACTRGYWLPGHSRAFFGLFRVSAQLCVETSRNPPWVLLSGMVAAPSVLLTWYWRDRKRRDDHQLALESGIAERYTRAAELLASGDAMTRINGLFALWDVARESASHRATVARTLAAFVRVRSAPATESASDPLPDVQTAVTLVADLAWGNPDWHSNGERVSVDLRGAHLAAFDFGRKDLSKAFLREANLSGAFLHHANLRGALLMLANLSGAFLRSADLRGANLRDADLTNANLLKADLRDTNLARARLAGARYCAQTTRFPAEFEPEQHGLLRADLSE